MNLRHLRCFIVVATEMHFARAAEQIGVSPATVSQSIRALEDELGFALFERSSHRVALTGLGVEFLQEARPAYAAVESAYLSAKRRNQNDASVSVGYTPALGQLLLPTLVEECEQRSKSTKLKPIQMHTHQQLAAIESGRIDVGVCWAPRIESPLCTTIIAKCPFLALLRTDNHLAQAPLIRLADLRHHHLVISPRKDNLFIDARLQSAIFQAGIATADLQEVASYEELAINVAAQDWIGIHPATVLLAQRVNDVAYKRLDEASLELEICAVYRTTETRDSVRALVKSLARIAPPLVNHLVTS